MSSEFPSHLHVNLQPNGTSFKRTFEQFGYDSSPPMTSALQASGSGAGNHHIPTTSSTNSAGNERNKRARSTSSSSLSDRSADSSRSSEYNTARSSASLSESSANDQSLSLDHNMRSPDFTVPIIASPSSTCTLATPAPLLSSSEPQNEHMSDTSGFSLDIPRPALLPTVLHPTPHDTLRSHLERYSEFDSHIAALRRSHSPSPSWIRAASPAQPPLPSSNATPEAFDTWDWTQLGGSPSSSHTSGEDSRHQFSTEVESEGTYSAVPRQGDSLSSLPSDGLSRPGYAALSSNTSSSTSTLTIPPHPPYRPSSSSRTNIFPQEFHEFPNSSTRSHDSVDPVQRNITDTLDGLDSRQGADRSSSGPSNFPWAPFDFPRPPPTPSPPDITARSGLLDSVFAAPTSDLPTTAHGARRSVHSGIGSRTMSSARPSANTSSVLADFYIGNEVPHRGASNTFEADNDPPPFLPAGRHEEHAARVRTLAGHSRNSSRPFSEVFATFDRERAAQESGEAEPSIDPLFAEDSTDHARRHRMMTRHVYNATDEDNEDDDDASHPERVHEIIENLHNARGLLERGVETARSLSGLPPRPEPRPSQPQARLRFSPHLYASATTVSSNSLVSESAAEHRRTNARAQLRSDVFPLRPNVDEPPRDASEFSSLTAAARLRRLIANQTDPSSSSSSSNAPSRPPISGRVSNLASRPFEFNRSGPSSQLPRGGLDDRERVRFAEILSDRRHPQTRSVNERSPSRDRNRVSEGSLDSIFDPVFSHTDALPDFPSSADGEAPPPYGYRSPTPPLHGLRARSRSPSHLPWERPQAPMATGDSSARSHPFSNVNLDEFPPGIYRDSLRRSIQASQGRGTHRMPQPTAPYEPPTFSLGNSDEDDDSDDSYFGVMQRHGRRERTGTTGAWLAPRRSMPDPTSATTLPVLTVNTHDRPLQSNGAFPVFRGRTPPLRRQPNDDHLVRHRANEPERGLPNSPLDPFWAGLRRDSTHDPRATSWEGSDARERARVFRDLVDRYGTASERSDLASRRDIPPPHQGAALRPGNPNRHSLLPWRSSLIHFHGSSSTGSPSNSRSSSDSSGEHHPHRNISDRPRDRQEPTPPEERTPMRTLRQRASLIRGAAPRAEGTRIRSMFRTMARRNLGDYVPDELFDSSYESLLSLGETLGEARSKATPADVIASLPTGTYQGWAKEDSDTRCPICLDDYERDDPVMKLVECTHWLHKTCMEQWLKTANTCPVCRKKVKGSPKCSFKPNPASTTTIGVASYGGSGPRTPESGTSGNRIRSDSTPAPGTVGIRFSDLLSRARRGSNAQSGGGNQQPSPSRAQTGDQAAPGATHYHHYHYHYLHIHPPRPDQSQFPDPYRQPPNATATTTATATPSGTGPRAFPTAQNTGGPRPNASNRPALSRPASWFGSMTGRASARRLPESTQDSGARFPSSPMEYEGSGFARTSSFTSDTPSFHHPVPAPQNTFVAPPTSDVPFSQVGGSLSSSSSSSSTTVSNRLDTYSLAAGELQQPFHGTSRTSAGSLGRRSHMGVHPNHAGSAVQHLGSFNTDDGLDSRSTATGGGYVRPGVPGASGIPPRWW